MSAGKEGSRVGTLRVGVRCRLIPGVPFVPAIVRWKNLAVTRKNHENKGKQSFCFHGISLVSGRLKDNYRMVFFVSELSCDPASKKQNFERAYPSLNANEVVII
jgi:hypothetical protein